MEHIHTAFHTPEAITKAKSVSKDKLKHTIRISDIQALRKKTEIQLLCKFTKYRIFFINEPTREVTGNIETWRYKESRPKL